MNAVVKPETAVMPTPNVVVLCAAWLKAKSQEQQAKDARVAIEQQLIALTGFTKPEGSQTFNLDGFKVECKAGLNYSLDQEKWKEIEQQIPDGLRPVKLKVEVDEKGAKFLRTNEPEVWAIAAQAITVKPAKVGVTVSHLEGK